VVVYDENGEIFIDEDGDGWNDAWGPNPYTSGSFKLPGGRLGGTCTLQRFFIWSLITFWDVYAFAVNLETTGYEGVASANLFAWFFGDFLMMFFILIMALSRDGSIEIVYTIWRYVHGFFEAIVVIATPVARNRNREATRNFRVSLIAGVGGLYFPMTGPETCILPNSVWTREDAVGKDEL